MADPSSRPLYSDYGYQDDDSHTQQQRRAPGINIFGLSNNNSSSGYHLMPSGGHEMADLNDSAPGLGISNMGSASNAHSQSPDPTHHARMSPPETPHSFHNLLGDSTNSSPRHQPDPSFSPRVANSQGTPEPYSEIWAPSMPRSARNSNTDLTDASEKVKEMPRTQQREITPSSSSRDGPPIPKIVEPRKDEMDDEFDDEIFYRKFGKLPCPCPCRCSVGLQMNS
jgi:hypothetical protein